MAVGGSDPGFVEKRVSVICSQRRKGHAVLAPVRRDHLGAGSRKQIFTGVISDAEPRAEQSQRRWRGFSAAIHLHLAF